MAATLPATKEAVCERAQEDAGLIWHTGCFTEHSAIEDFAIAIEYDRVGQPLRRDIEQLAFVLKAGADKPKEWTHCTQKQNGGGDVDDDQADAGALLHYCSTPLSRKR